MRQSLCMILTGATLSGCGVKLGAFLPSSPPAPTSALTNTNTPKPTSQPTITPTSVPTTPIPATPTPAPTAPPVPTPLPVQISFYSYFDNGNTNAITYPTSGGYFTTHTSAGGTGTFTDPLSAASSTSVFPIGTKLYIRALLKYVVMESSCISGASCEQDWTASSKRDLEIWTGGNQTTLAAAMSNCQGNLTAGVLKSSAGSTALPNPSAGLTVDTTPLFSAVPPTITGAFSWVCYF